MLKKRIVSIVLVCMMLVGCKQSLLDSKNPVVLTMWHNYGGDMQAIMDLLIDEFNSTVGKKEGIVIDVTAISSSSELNKSLSLILNDDPGAPDMPDIFTGYPKVAIGFAEKDMICDLNDYFTEKELALYVDVFVEEGRLLDGGLYVFPLAKSTEVLYVNQTLFNEFAKETGADAKKLETFEGITQLSSLYYNWTGGKSFFAADSWFNVAEVAMEQFGSSIFQDSETLALENEHYAYIFTTICKAAVEGGIAIYDGYSSDLSKTGDVICSLGSSAGILFYGDTITYSDGTIKEVEYNILPYPIWEDGEQVALQRGGGLIVTKNTEQKEYAASIFLKWLTDAKQNMQFVSQTGYLPVTKEAFEEQMPTFVETVEDTRIAKMLTAVLDMYEHYTFFFAPNYRELDSMSEEYETNFKELIQQEK